MYFRYGFNVDGFNKKREVRTYNNSLSTGDQIYNSYGYDRNGKHLMIFFYLRYTFIVFDNVHIRML